MIGPIIRGYKEYRTNKKLQEKVNELEKFSRNPQKNLFSKSEQDKIKRNISLIQLYKEGVVNGISYRRIEYYKEIMKDTQQNINDNKAKLEKTNAKKIDIARIGLSLQKLAMEMDVVNTELETTKDEFQDDLKSVKGDFKSAKNNLETKLAGISKGIENFIDSNKKVEERLNNHISTVKADMESISKDIDQNRILFNEQINQTYTEIEKWLKTIDKSHRKEMKRIEARVDKQNAQIQELRKFRFRTDIINAVVVITLFIILYLLLAS